MRCGKGLTPSFIFLFFYVSVFWVGYSITPTLKCILRATNNATIFFSLRFRKFGTSQMKRSSKGNVSTPAKRSRFTKPKRNRYPPPSSVPRYRNLSQLPMVNIGVGFPKRMTVTHKYVDGFVQLSSNGSKTNYNFSCNGMYDPNTSGGGHQPLYFDQLTALYNHYTVIYSEIKATFVPLLSSTTPLAYGVLINDDTTTTPGNYNEMIEQAQVSGGYTTAIQTANPMASMKWSAKKYFGGSVLANTDLQGTVTSNPTEQSYFTCFIQPLDALTACAVNLIVEVTYVAVWSEVKDIVNS